MTERGRTYELVVGVFMMAVVLLCFKKIDAGNFTTITLGIVGAYVTKTVFENKNDNKPNS